MITHPIVPKHRDDGVLRPNVDELHIILPIYIKKYI